MPNVSTKGDSFDDMENLISVLKRYFRHNSLRPNQHSVICSLLSKCDTLFTAPTGHGKSLTFQLPALYLHTTSPNGRLSLVVTPLLSLMHNHVKALRTANIPCAMLSSAEPPSHNAAVLKSLRSTPIPYALLYLTPEKLLSDSFLLLLDHLYEIGRLGITAIDEAHCISQWGHNFRTAYARLGLIKHRFPDLPIVALTATATPRVRNHILSSLNIPHATCLHMSFLRSNTRYEVRYADVLPIALHQHVLDYVLSRREGGRFETGLVYAFKRDTVERLAEILKDGGVPALPYHGGMPTAARRRTQEAFERGETPVVVASTAFGMGIDVAGIRYVVHHSMPKSIEAFYQESGRAGRDGRACDSVLYYSEKDVELYTFLNSRDDNVEKSVAQARADRLQKMKDYCMKVRCRRLTLLEYFGEKASAKEVCGKGCDVCSARDDVRARMRVHVPTQRGLDKKRKTGTEFQTARSLLKRVLEVKGDEAKARKRKTSAKDDIEAYSDTENNIKVTGDIGLVGVTKRRKGSLRRVDFRRYAPSNL